MDDRIGEDAELKALLMATLEGWVTEAQVRTVSWAKPTLRLCVASFYLSFCLEG